MKRTGIILFILFLTTGAFAQTDSLLCKANENIVFAFQLENNKWASVCKEKNGKYLVYRFGNKNKIEIQVPAVLDTASWNRFMFNGYSRGGGKENAAMHFAYLSFRNREMVYEMFETWNSEDSLEHCGLSVMTDNKVTIIAGVLKSRHGNLLDLLYDDHFKKEEEN